MSATHQILLSMAKLKPAAVLANASTVVTTGGTAAASIAASLPTRIAGNLLVAYVSARQSSGSITALAPSAGWTKFGEFLSSLRSFACYWRIATNNASDALTITPAGALCFMSIEMLHFTGAHASAAPEAGVGTTGVDPPSLNPSFGAEYSLYMAFTAPNQTASFTGYPSGWDLFQNASAPGANGNEAMLCRAGLNNFGSQNPGSFSITSSGNACSQTIAIRSAA